jgi:hypothetical protein
MKIGFYSEERADQAALAVFAEGILGEPPEPINIDLEAHGVSAVLRGLDGVLRGVHYNSDAAGFVVVVVVDSDDTDLHDSSHDANPGKNCRFCQIREIAQRVQKQLKPIAGKSPLKVAIGLAVPAIEAWYLVGKNHQVGEAAWKVNPPFTRAQLKKLVYATDRPSIEHSTACAVTEARRVIANLAAIESAFPIGFGLMAQEIRSCKIKGA